jgi:hypothetical protein
MQSPQDTLAHLLPVFSNMREQYIWYRREYHCYDTSSKRSDGEGTGDKHPCLEGQEQ